MLLPFGTSPSSPGVNVNTAGASFFWGGVSGSDVITMGSIINNAAGWIANQAYAVVFYLPFATTITRATIQITTLSAGSIASAGVYSMAGTLLINSGSFSTSATGTFTNVFTAVPLAPGFYVYVFTTNSATPGFTYMGTNSVSLASYVNANGVRAGKGSATTSGLLNSTLGTLAVASLMGAIPACLFEP